MAIIVQITRQNEWRKAFESGSYAADTLATQGFIHCSTPAQVVPVANLLFRGRKDLVLLCIDTTMVDSEIKYENLEGGTELFPHVYGRVPVPSVVRVFDFLPKDDGTFELPFSTIQN